MHQTIAIITRADDQDEAVSRAQEIFNEQLANRSTGFDWCDPHTEGVVEDGIIWEPTYITSDNAKKMAEYLFISQQEERTENLEKIRMNLNELSNEEILFGGDSPDQGRELLYHMREAGAVDGPAIKLYCEDWFGINTRRSFNFVMDEMKSNGKHWIVPMDSHF